MLKPIFDKEKTYAVFWSGGLQANTCRQFQTGRVISFLVVAF